MMKSFRKEMDVFNTQFNIEKECKYLAWLCRGTEESGENRRRYNVHRRVYSTTLQIRG